MPPTILCSNLLTIEDFSDSIIEYYKANNIIVAIKYTKGKDHIVTGAKKIEYINIYQWKEAV